MEEIRLTSWYGKYPIIYKVLYIPGGFFYQQYHLGFAKRHSSEVEPFELAIHEQTVTKTPNMFTH